MSKRGTAVLVAVLVCVIVVAFWSRPWLALVAVPLAILLARYSDRSRRRFLEALCSRREGESICTFARSFDVRAVDPWITRATYEEVAAFFQDVDVLPLRPSDRFDKDLWILGDDLPGLVGDIAQRAGREIGEPSLLNPPPRLDTVGDLVEYLNAQRRTIPSPQDLPARPSWDVRALAGPPGIRSGSTR